MQVSPGRVMLNNSFSFWATKNDNKPDLLCGRPADYFVVQKHFTILICATIVLGGFSRMVLKNSEVFVLMILSLSGFVTGRLAYHFVEVHQIVYPLLKTPSFSLYSYFLPLIVFVAALDVDFYIVKNVFWQVLLTGVISFGTALSIISFVVLKMHDDTWDVQCSMLFSITMCIIDPLHSVNSLKTIGISKMYTDIIRGESLIICSFTCIFFGIFRGHTTNFSMFRELHVIIGLSFDIFGSTICGYWCTRVIQIILTDLFSNSLTNVVLCFSLVYMTFYLVEYFGMSGIVALVTVGLNLDSLSFKPRMEFIITKFLIMCSSVYEHLIYAFFGIVIGCGEIQYFRFHSLVFIVTLFVTVNFVRLLTIILVSPILMHSSYEYDWRWGVVIAWSGIRGVFSLLLAPDIYNFSEFKLPAPHMSSFEKQCNDGILGVEAARILIGATKSYCPIHGKFMSISDVSTYVRARSWLIKFKNMLTYIEYHKERVLFTVPGNNKFLIFVYRIIISEEFEYASHVVTVMYIFPMIIHLWPTARELNVSALTSINYYFMFLYTLESALKMLILKRKYFLQNWNTLDFFIIVIGIIDILCMYFVKLRPDSLVFIQITVVIGYLRVIRFLPIFKIIVPILINMADIQIKKSLSLMYSITKGYVKSQEDAKLLVRQISGRESIYRKLYDILEKNKREAIRELGLIEHEGRDVVIALKTKQTVRNVIAKALKNLTFLWSRGIIDKHEGIEMNKVLLTKIKALNNFPMAIPPPTPDKYLPNIIWMENKDVLIEFFKERTKLTYFDYGDIICREGEMPQGVFLIISGMASLHSSSPNFGIDASHINDRQYKIMYTEYCTSGDVLGELSCLLKREIEYTAICETTLQAFFISLEDLYEGFDVFWPSLEYKMWLKLALSIANQYFESSIAGEDLKFQKCVMFNHAYVETLSSYNEMTLNHVTMKLIILVYGNVINSKTEETHVAPCIIPKSCEQIQGISDVSKLLIIPTSEPVKNDATSHAMVNTGLRTTKKDYSWKRKDELQELMWRSLSSARSYAYICESKGLVTLGQNRIEPSLKVDTSLESHFNETALMCGARSGVKSFRTGGGCLVLFVSLPQQRIVTCGESLSCGITLIEWAHGQFYGGDCLDR
ncbi:sodium/hydrogen exchanger 11 [Grammomys surdaster]|uniref:sodium/hydrogen exchanger 11 n=1 Tax=Grammomys surdaster TaxID=491861 RepID=UPI00109FB5C7|nr:sodium/hydrogen exchanger 11 [Grammomys surdaster]